MSVVFNSTVVNKSINTYANVEIVKENYFLIELNSDNNCIHGLPKHQELNMDPARITNFT